MHFSAKIPAPSLEDPLPGGSPFPSGPMEMSSAWTCCFVAGVPMPLYAGIGVCAAAAEATSAMPAARSLENRIFHAPVPVHFPGLNGIHIARDERRLLEEINVRTPYLGHFGHTWLNYAIVVRAAGHQQRLFSFPIPRSRKPGVGLARDGILQLRILPAPAAVRRDFHPANGSASGPGKAGDLVESRCRQMMPARRTRDY